MSDILCLWALCYLLLTALRNAIEAVNRRDTPEPAAIPTPELNQIETDPMGVAQ